MLKVGHPEWTQATARREHTRKAAPVRPAKRSRIRPPTACLTAADHPRKNSKRNRDSERSDSSHLHERKLTMNTNFKIALAVVAGAALGATAMQGLHAQAKLKAYSISENVITDDAAVAKYLPAVRKAIADNHGKSFLTLRGRVVPIEGAAPPSNVGIVEWDSVDDALAFFKSPAWKAFDAERDKAQKTTTRFIVEVEK